MITASILMYYKAPVLVDALRAKMSSITSIAMDCLRKHRRPRPRPRQRQSQRPLPCKLLRLHRLLFQLLLQRLHLLRHPCHDLQLHRAIVNKLYRCQKFVD